MPRLTIGTKVNRYLKLKQEIAANDKAYKDKQTKLLSKMELLQADIIQHMKSEGVDEVGGTVGKVTYTTKPVANVKDWQKFYNWIGKEKAFFMLHKRVSQTAYEELLNDKVKIPGVVRYNKPI